VAQRQLRTSALGADDTDYDGVRIGGDMANRRDDGAPEPVRIDALSPELASEAGDLLAASHADYPSFRHLFPDPTTAGAAPLHERHSARCRSSRTGHGCL
jgi:hypothetical protein